MKKPFNQCSYLAQVRRLRKFAKSAFAEYPIKVKAIHFINHGENATFRIESTKRKFFLLRIHRNDYHTKSAIVEEMKWLSQLSKKGHSVPRPVISKKGNLVETVFSDDLDGSRNCSVFEWIHGEFVQKSVKPRHMIEIGKLLADFQNNTPKLKTKQRMYWTAEGLVGAQPKFGSLDHLSSIPVKEQKAITSARKSILKKLKAFEKGFPQRQGLIHADLHFGNLISTQNRLSAIDFDDCGYGFFAYDLVIPYISVQYLLGKKKKHLAPDYLKALIEGYKSKRNWDKEDDKIFPYLVAARKLLMLGWLNSRSDNPRLRNYLKESVKNAILHLKSASLFK